MHIAVLVSYLEVGAQNAFFQFTNLHFRAHILVAAKTFSVISVFVICQVFLFMTIQNAKHAIQN